MLKYRFQIWKPILNVAFTFAKLVPFHIITYTEDTFYFVHVKNTTVKRAMSNVVFTFTYIFPNVEVTCEQVHLFRTALSKTYFLVYVPHH